MVSAAPHPWDLPPHLSARFELKRSLGRGASATVRHAWDRYFERHVAIKAMHAGSEWARAQLRRDFRVAAGFRSPWLPRVFEQISVDHTMYVVMEHFEGFDLERAMDRSEAIDPMRLAEGLLGGLATLHRAGLVHGDVKPANILLRPGSVVLGDLGLCRFHDGRDTQWSGTPAYMPPEALRRLPRGPGADIYAAGLVIFELISGAAVDPDKRQELSRIKLTGRLPAMPPPPFGPCLERMLSPDPDDRPTALEVLEMLSLQPPETPAPPAASLEALHRWWSGPDPIAIVSGPSGAGKSELVNALATTLLSRGTGAVTARCHPHARTPLFALDALVDALLADLEDGDPTLLPILRQAFPQLGELQGAAPASDSLSPTQADIHDALRSIVESASPLLWVIDEGQWLDEDSESIITRLVGAGALRILVVVRDPNASIAAQLGDTAFHLRVPPRDRPPSPNPVLESEVAEILGAIDEAVPIVAIAELLDDPLRWGAVRACEDVGLCVTSTRGQAVWVEWWGPPSEPSTERLCQIAEALERHDAPPGATARLYLRAHQPHRARPLALRAFDEALSRGAGHNALMWSELLVDVAPDRAVLSRAEALATLGRFPESATCIAALARDAPTEDARALMLASAAERWVGAGDVDDGLKTLTEAGRAVGLPLDSAGRSLLRIAADALWFARHGLSLAPHRTLTAREEGKLMVAWVSAGPLIFLDSATSVALVLRYLRLATSSGRVDHACRAASLLWNLLYQARLRPAWSDALASAIDTWLPHASPDARAFSRSIRAYGWMFTNRIAESIPAFDDALSSYPPGQYDRWERPFTEVNRLIARHFVQPTTDGWVREVERARHRVSEAGNVLATSTLDLGVGYLIDLWHDDPNAARTRIDEAFALFPNAPPLHLWLVGFARARVALFEGDGASAHRELDRVPFQQVRLFQHIRVSYWWLRALAELASDAPRSSQIRRWMRRLEAETDSWGVAHHLAIRAALEKNEAAQNRAFERYAQAGMYAFTHKVSTSTCDEQRWYRLFWPDHGTLRAVIRSPHEVVRVPAELTPEADELPSDGSTRED